MKKYIQLGVSSLFFLFILFSSSCSTMTFSKYTLPNENLFQRSSSRIFTIVKPVMDKNDTKKYFGIDLIKRGTLPIYLAIRNDTIDGNYIFQVNSVHIAQVKSDGVSRNPGGKEETAAYAMAVLGSPLLAFAAAQLESNATFIKENFEDKRIRDSSIDPGETISGFAYFNWNELKDLNNVEVCFDLVDPLANKSIPLCAHVKLRG